MKKLKGYFLVFFIIINCTSCAGDERITSDENSIDSSVEPVMYDFTDYHFRNSSVNIVSEDENFYFYKKVRHSSGNEFDVKQYTVNLSDSQDRKIDYLFDFDEDYAYYSCDSTEDKPGEIGIVDYAKNAYQKIIELPKGSQAGIETVDQNYIVWKESLNDSNWGITRLHLYDKATNKDIVFYNNAIDVDTKRVFAWNWSKPVIIEDTVYFDDVVGVENDIYKVNMLKYDIKEKKITTVKKMAKWPISYKNGIIWQQLNSDGVNTDVIFYNGTQEKHLFSFNNRSVSSIIGHSDRFAMVNQLNSEMLTKDTTQIYDSVDCAGLQIFSDNNIQQILITKPTQYIQNPIICGDFLSFYLNTEHPYIPKLYNFKTDEIIELSDLSKDFYNIVFSEQYAYFSCKEDNHLLIYRIKLR